MGKDGAYASGSYNTGIKGLTAMKGASNSKVIAAMKDATHGYSGKMSDTDFTDLANFVTKGQIDIDAVIERKSKKANGDAGKGEAYYKTVCAGCHGPDGKEPKDMPALGGLSNKNPWEVIQKILNGQPKEKMPVFSETGSIGALAFVPTSSLVTEPGSIGLLSIGLLGFAYRKSRQLG